MSLYRLLKDGDTRRPKRLEEELGYKPSIAAQQAEKFQLRQKAELDREGRELEALEKERLRRNEEERQRIQAQRGHYVTTDMVRELRDMIAYRHELDSKTWREGRTEELHQRDLIEEDMRRADHAHVTICANLKNWDRREYFATENEYQEFMEIKTGIEKAEMRNWSLNPPWIEEQPDVGKNIQDLSIHVGVSPDGESLHESLKFEAISHDPNWFLDPTKWLDDSTSHSDFDCSPEVADERLRWIEKYQRIFGGPSKDHGSTRIGTGSGFHISESSLEAVVEVRQKYTRRDRAQPDHVPLPRFDNLDKFEPLSDAEETECSKGIIDKQPTFAFATLNAIVTDFGLHQILQNLLEQASTLLSDEKLFEFFRDILQKYHGNIVSDPSDRTPPQIIEVLGISNYREIIARRVLDDRIFAQMSSDDEENAFIKATTKMKIVEKLNDFSHIKTENYAFQNMLDSMRELLLPSDLLEELLSIPRNHITYETGRKSTILEICQRRFESWTGLEWDWWPLPASMRPLSSEESRILWRCSCGINRWRDLRRGQLELLRQVLAHRPVVPANSGSCVVTQKLKESFTVPFHTRLGSGPSIGRTTSQARSTASIAQSRYTPAGANSTNVSSVAGGSNTGNMGGGPSIGTSSGNPTSSNSPIGTNKQMWIIFGVEGPLEPLELSQINNDYLHNDQTFIRELRQRHWKLRGLLRILFSIWRLRYWEFVKFDPQPYGPNRAVVQEVDLPVSKDYEYTPRPPKIKATDEGIRHSFTAMVQACVEPCPLGTLPFGHVCRRLNGRKTHYVDRIPKRLKEWTSDDEDPDDPYIWGIQARYKPCIFAVWMIHTLIIGGAFGFWGWWQKIHPDDVQGAAVPVTIAIALISLFWSTAGVIPSLR